MPDDKLAVIILDAIDNANIKQLGLDKIQKLTKQYNSEVLGISTLPHTALSNPMIWAEDRNTDKLWVKEPGQKWTDPSTGFDRQKGDKTEQAEKIWKRKDFKTTFAWDVLDYHGLNASAVHIPITLPPYSFNEVRTLEEAWFPSSREHMKEHIREAPEIIKEHADEDRHFIASSIQMPDKWLHGLAEGQCDQEFIREEAKVLDQKIESMIEHLQSKGYDWVILGDHGSPWRGAIKLHDVRQVLPRHRKSSVIISNLDDIPTYTEDIYSFILDYFNVEDVEYKDLGESYLRLDASERNVPDFI